MDRPTFVQLLWICAIVIFAEYRHGFTLQGATLLNSMLLVLPQPLEKIKWSINRQAWKDVRRWLLALRLICAMYLISHITSWTDHPIEQAVTSTTLVMLLPFLFLSEKQRERVRHDFNRIIFGLSFEEGDMVRLRSARKKPATKIVEKCNIGPYRIVKKVGAVSYELEIPKELNSVKKVFNVDEFEKVSDYAYVLRGNLDLRYAQEGHSIFQGRPRGDAS